MALAGPRRHRLRRAGRDLRSVLSDGRGAGTRIEFFDQAFAGKSRKACFLEKRCWLAGPQLDHSGDTGLCPFGTQSQIVMTVLSFARTSRATPSGTATPACR